MKNKSGIMSGAAVLFASNLIVKITGMLYKIPLQRILTDTGTGYFSLAYNVYVWFYVITSAGIPSAVSVCIARETSKNRPDAAGGIYRASLLFFGSVGAAASLLTLVFCRGIASLSSLYDAYPCIAAISPCVFFSCVTSAVRGYYQGHGIMWVTAVSQLIESVGKLSFGLLFCSFASHAALPLSSVAAYAVFGISCGSFLSALFCISVKSFYCRSDGAKRIEAPVLFSLLKIALPVALSSSVMNVTAASDAFIVPRLLCASGYTEPSAAGIYGNYSTVCVSLVNLPSALVSPVCQSVLPRLTSAYHNKDKEKAYGICRSMLGVCLLLTLPSASGLFVLSYQIPALIFTEASAAVSAPMLAVLSPCAVLIPLLSVTDTVLQSTGKPHKTLAGMSSGAAVKLLSLFIMFRFTALDVLCIPASTCLCYLTAVVFNAVFTADLVKPDIVLGFKIAVSSVLCAVTAKAVYGSMCRITPDRIATAAAVFAAVCSYALILLASGAFSDVLALDDKITIFKKKVFKNDGIRNKRKVRI